MPTTVETPPPAQKRLYTVEDWLAMPDDGVDRWIINGQLRERKDPEMTKRNRFHSALVTRIGQLIGNWIDTQPEPRGEVYGGEVGVYLRRNPDSAVGIDVVYMQPGAVTEETDGTTMIDGIPTLAIEILSPSNTVEEVTEKTASYLKAGVPLVWVVDPYFRTVAVYCPNQPPEMFNTTHTLNCDPHMPGFSVPVIRLFRRG